MFVSMRGPIAAGKSGKAAVGLSRTSADQLPFDSPPFCVPFTVLVVPPDLPSNVIDSVLTLTDKQHSKAFHKLTLAVELAARPSHSRTV